MRNYLKKEADLRFLAEGGVSFHENVKPGDEVETKKGRKVENVKGMEEELRRQRGQPHFIVMTGEATDMAGPRRIKFAMVHRTASAAV